MSDQYWVVFQGRTVSSFFLVSLKLGGLGVYSIVVYDGLVLGRKVFLRKVQIEGDRGVEFGVINSFLFRRE